jgi:hypothetical protein
LSRRHLLRRLISMPSGSRRRNWSFYKLKKTKRTAKGTLKVL